MTTRTFKQFGQAYGATPAVITATIGGTVVFSGEVATVDAPWPSLPNVEITGTELYTWTNTVEFAGTQSFSLSVANSPLLLADTLADYIANNSAQFGSFYSYQDSGTTISDPFSNVAIDGVIMQKSPEYSELLGQWYWQIPAGSTFTATLNISAGNVPTSP